MMSSPTRPILLTGLALFAIAVAFISSRPPIPAPGIEPANRRVTARPQRTSQSNAGLSKESMPEKIKRCIATGDTIGMQTLVSKWFDQDPVAVRDWLETQNSLKPLQPALVQITKDISAAGSPADALKWAELLETGPDRDQALFEIYATGRRYGSLSDDEIRRAPFTPRQIEDLLSGAADD